MLDDSDVIVDNSLDCSNLLDIEENSRNLESCDHCFDILGPTDEEDANTDDEDFDIQK